MRKYFLYDNNILVLLKLLIIFTCLNGTIPFKLSFFNSDNDNSNHKFSKDDKFLKYFKFEHMSGSTSHSYCPDMTYFTGARIRRSNFLNQTYPVVTMVELLCSDRIKLRAHPKTPLILEKIIGDWEEYNECPNGRFVTGFLFHLQNIKTDSLIFPELPESDTNTKDSSGRPNVLWVGRSRYVSGITVNCSLGSNYAFTLGKNSDFKLMMYCRDDRKVSGISLVQEAIISYNQERRIPVKISMKCARLVNPAIFCTPDLTWERLSAKCKPDDDLPASFIISDTTQFRNVTCNAMYAVGTNFNMDIKNLAEIRTAYNTANLESEALIAYIIRSKLRSGQFRQEWTQKYNLSMVDYRNVTLSKELYSILTNKSSDVIFNVKSESPLLSTKPSNKTETIKQDFVITQLVGYCSIYKIHFPIISQRHEKYLFTTIDGIPTRIAFSHLKI